MADIGNLDIFNLTEGGYTYRSLTADEVKKLGIADPQAPIFILEPPVWPIPRLSDEDKERILVAYDEAVRANYSEGWNTIRAVFCDSSGEVGYEVLDIADGLGILNDDNRDGYRDQVWDLADVYKARIANDPLNHRTESGDEE